MKKITPYLLLLTVFILFLTNCEKENEFTFTNPDSVKKETVSFEEAKSFFNEVQKKNLAKKSSNNFAVTPDWNSLGHNEIRHTDALLTTADVSVNRSGNFYSQLFFIKLNGEMRNVIFTIYKDNINSNEDIINARVFFNEINGDFIDAYKIEKGLFTKRLIPRRKVSKASFFTFLQHDEDQDCWNTDNLDVEGGTFDEVYLGSVSSSGGGGGDGNYYFFINNPSHTTTGSGPGYATGGSIATSAGTTTF